MKPQKGIIGAGNWILDITKTIDIYPQQDTLSNILSQSSNNGGAAYNVLKDLVRLEAPFPLYGIGLIGNDEAGQYILNDCQHLKIDTSGLKILHHAITSYTDVMLVKNTGRRTFFHHRGANAYLESTHFNFNNYDARIFHLGYLLLLDQLDTFIDKNKTQASLVLEKAKEQGLITSVDLVSESSDRFEKIIKPSLPYIDFLFLNEYEAGKLTGMDLLDYRSEKLKVENAIKVILAKGVRQWVILHFPEGVVAGHVSGDFLYQGSIHVPVDKIVGTTGAGDAFAAGVLFGLHEQWDMDRCLKLGVCSAACSLTSASCSDGIIPYTECLNLSERYGFRQL